MTFDEKLAVLPWQDETDKLFNKMGLGFMVEGAQEQQPSTKLYLHEQIYQLRAQLQQNTEIINNLIKEHAKIKFLLEDVLHELGKNASNVKE